MLSGKIYDASEVERVGLVNHVYGGDSSLARSRELAERRMRAALAEASPGKLSTRV
jgi:enoyl-CoA hydratase/carnithine racemase